MAETRLATIPRPGAPVEVRTVPRPDLEPGAAWLEIEASEVCGTDRYLQQGLLGGVPYPLVPGHVTVGRLAEARGKVHDVHGRTIQEGERITFLDVHGTCGACWHCLVAQATTRCPSRRVYGITYGLDDGPSGGWAEGMLLKPGTKLIPLGDTTAEHFLAGGCGLPTALHAVERGRVRMGDTVLVLGTGPVGLSAIALARLAGAFQVLAIGAPQSRVQVASAMGADATLDLTGLDFDARLAWVHEHTEGRGADLVIEATGVPDAVVESLRMARDAGRVSIVGQYTDHGEASFNPHTQLNAKHLDVVGVWGSDFSHFERSVRLMSDPVRSAPWTHIPQERFGLDDLNEALERVGKGNVVKALVDPRTGA